MRPCPAVNPSLFCSSDPSISLSLSLLLPLLLPHPLQWPRMPCLRCGCPWWLGEDWDARCARCGCGAKMCCVRARALVRCPPRRAHIVNSPPPRGRPSQTNHERATTTSLPPPQRNTTTTVTAGTASRTATTTTPTRCPSSRRPMTNSPRRSEAGARRRGHRAPRKRRAIWWRRASKCTNGGPPFADTETGAAASVCVACCINTFVNHASEGNSGGCLEGGGLARTGRGTSKGTGPFLMMVGGDEQKTHSARRRRGARQRGRGHLAPRE